MKRRDFLKSSLAAATLTAMGCYDIASAEEITPSSLFTTPLPIPPMISPGDFSGRGDLFTLSVQKSSRSFFRGVSTPTLGYNGSFLGPTIRVKNGEQFKLRVRNTLREKTTVHWHGLHVPARWDGGPRQIIQPGREWNPEFTIRQQAATLWYHPHAMGTTGEQVYQGLAGLFIIEDAVSENLPIPSTYGEDDLPIFLQDRRFLNNGKFAYIRSMHDVMHGVAGNFLLVNGSLNPVREVPHGIVRLRVLNGSNSSIYRLRLTENKPFHVIASDGGFLTRPVQLTNLVLSAGERAELLVDFSENRPGDLLHLLVDQYNGRKFTAMQFRVGQRKGTFSTIPWFLREQRPLAASSADNTRHFALQTMSGAMGMSGGNRLTINNKKMSLGRIDERIKLGTTEIWILKNTSAHMMQLPHSMHIHDVQFNILERNGKKPSPVEAGRKDTVLLYPGETVKIIARFEDYTGIYMYHCHMLEHEDDGMMGQFEVVAEPDIL